MADSKVHLLDRLCRFTRQERETEEIDYDPEDAATMDMLSNDEKMKRWLRHVVILKFLLFQYRFFRREISGEIGIHDPCHNHC